MSIQIYNSLTKKKENLKSLKKNIINIYSCGVTVYDQSHIGHARSLYVFDVIRKYLQYRHPDYKINFIRNITDIDDKIINKAQELNKDWKEVVDENIASYYKDLEDLGIGRADVEPRATENIDDMVKHIQKLIDDEYAYEAGGDVYFNVRKFKDYGQLSGQSIEKMLDGVRIEPGEQKKDPLDFALWKKSKEGEPSWPSPWSDGRPGWHIECSCMSMKFAQTQTLDIHAGGRDLIFPHHENEIAQSQAFTGKKFVKYWIHHGLLTINGQKMAKSLGNFITIQDAIEKYGVDDLKMFFLSSNYGSAIDFSDEKMIEAHKALERLNIFFHSIQEGVKKSNKEPEIIKQFRDKFLEAMDDDFNTPRGLAAIFELISEVYKMEGDPDYPAISFAAYEVILEIGRNIFGLFEKDFDVQSASADADVEALLIERAKARANKDFQKSDDLRDELKNKGIIVEDSKDGQKWRKA